MQPVARLLAFFVLAAALLGPLSLNRHNPARAEAGDIELSLTSEAVALVSDTVSATSDDNIGFTPGLRVGWSPVDQITVLAGWRSFVGFNRGDHGYTIDTTGDAIVLGARYSLGLHPIFDVHFEVDLEALHSDFELTVAGHHGTTSAWGFGIVPKVVASARTDLDIFAFDFRMFAGFAARTNLRADDLRLSADAPARQVAPLDLGSVNFSGVVFGLDFAIIF